MCAGEHGDSAGQLGIGGQRSVHVGVGAQDVRQRHRVGVVGLFPRHTVPFPVAGHRHRVDGVNLAAAGTQCRDQQPARGLDRHRDRVLGAVAGLGQHHGQFREPLDGLGDPPLGHQPAFGVDQGDVVLAFCPVDPAEHVQVRVLPPLVLSWLVKDLDENAQRPNDEALWPSLR